MSQITDDIFEALVARVFGDCFARHDALAIGVSGGADSMALLHLLQRWCLKHGKGLHVLSVNHGLRAQAVEECGLVAAYCEQFSHIIHQILVWDAPKNVRVQEEARRARYALMSEYCKAQAIGHLFLGHHGDDQAETFLFRLAKGSGIDGLSGMRVLQERDDLYLCRPFLDVEKSDLIDLCHRENIDFVQDPSNEDEGYARVRLRQSMDVLAAEGLSAKRLMVSAARMRRASDALDFYAQNAFNDYILIKDTKRIEFNIGVCVLMPEILIRVILKSVEIIGSKKDYAPRLERVETIAEDLQNNDAFRKRTLAGVIFERDDAQKRVILVCENCID